MKTTYSLLGLVALVLVSAIAIHAGVHPHLVMPALHEPSSRLGAGMCMELVSWLATHPGATPATGNATALGQNTLAIRNCDFSKAVRMLQYWGVNQAAGQIQITSPKLHDNVKGIHAQLVPAQANPLAPDGWLQRLYPQDTLTVTQSAADGAGDIEMGSMLLLYDDLPGGAARYISPDDLIKFGVNEMSVTNTLTFGATGQYTGQVAINTTDDQWKANTDYALIGYEVNGLCNCVRWQGSDTAGYGIGGPGNSVSRFITNDWFRRLSVKNGLAIIPVFNAANKQSILIDGQQDENATAVIVTSHFIEISAARR